MHVWPALNPENKDSGKYSSAFSLKIEGRVRVGGKSPQKIHRLGKREKLVRK